MPSAGGRNVSLRASSTKKNWQNGNWQNGNWQNGNWQNGNWQNGRNRQKCFVCFGVFLEWFKMVAKII